MTGQNVEQAEAEPDFYPGFVNHSPGDVILRADDDYLFHFRLAQLAELSSFFSTLPPPFDVDLRNGVPVIPLHGSTSPGLVLVLDAIQSTTSPAPYRFPGRPGDIDEETVLSAAVIARKYDLSIVYRLLIEAMALQTEENDDYPRNPYLEFGVWAIGDVESMLPLAAARTIKGDCSLISCIPDRIGEMCRDHAPRHWNQLGDLHLRHTQAIHRWARDIRDSPYLYLPFRGHHQAGIGGCVEEVSKTVGYELSQRLLKVGSIGELVGLRDDTYGLFCEVCMDEAEERFGSLIKGIEEFATAYVLERRH